MELMQEGEAPEGNATSTSSPTTPFISTSIPAPVSIPTAALIGGNMGVRIFDGIATLTSAAASVAAAVEAAENYTSFATQIDRSTREEELRIVVDMSNSIRHKIRISAILALNTDRVFRLAIIY